MTTLDKIKSKITHIDINEIIQRLNIELNIKDNEEIQKKAQTLLEYCIYDTLLLILDVTNLTKIDEGLYSIWLNMIKDYWYLNKYDKLLKINIEDENDDDDLEVTSIKTGDTQVNFSSKSSTLNINGTKYSTGTINFDVNILKEKYKYDLYRHRKFRWG